MVFTDRDTGDEDGWEDPDVDINEPLYPLDDDIKEALEEQGIKFSNWQPTKP